MSEVRLFFSLFRFFCAASLDFVGRPVVPRVSENVAELSENAHLGIGALDNVCGFLHFRPCIGNSGGNSGFTKSGEIVQIVAEIDGLLFFDPKVFLQQCISLAL